MRGLLGSYSIDCGILVVEFRVYIEMNARGTRELNLLHSV